MNDPREEQLHRLARAAAAGNFGGNGMGAVPSPDWAAELIRDKSGAVRSNWSANAEVALRASPGMNSVLEFCEFSQQIYLRHSAPWGSKGRWAEHDNTSADHWLQREYGIRVGHWETGRAALRAAQYRPFHPVRSYLNSLRWDGTPRIDKWLVTYLGAAESPFVLAAGPRWLISAVARIFQPGCKADHCLILEGEQGIYKSTALSVLGGEWFTDELDDMGSKDSSLQLRGVWIIELSELDAMSRSDKSRVKSFISKTTDRFRPPYAHNVDLFPRQMVFAGTCNVSHWMKDETGGRRFWPVRCTAIDIPGLERDRDQLWAEAVDRYRRKHPWWLDTAALVQAAEEEQTARYEGDPWQDMIAEWVEDPQARKENGYPVGDILSDPTFVIIEEILSHCLYRKIENWEPAHQARVRRCLTALGWVTGGQERRGKRGAQKYGYKPGTEVLRRRTAEAPKGST